MSCPGCLPRPEHPTSSFSPASPQLSDHSLPPRTSPRRVHPFCPCFFSPPLLSSSETEEYFTPHSYLPLQRPVAHPLITPASPFWGLYLPDFSVADSVMESVGLSLWALFYLSDPTVFCPSLLSWFSAAHFPSSLWLQTLVLCPCLPVSCTQSRAELTLVIVLDIHGFLSTILFCAFCFFF